MTPDGGGPTVVLIGPMAAGKSTIGRRLARILDVPFSDLDELIVEASGRTIPELFRDEGEEAFRELESRILRESLDARDGVLSVGGGAPMTPASREALASAPVVLLEITAEVARQRIGTGASRPMLSGEDPVATWRRLSEQRGPVYRSLARWRVDAGSESVPAVARRIARIIGAPSTRGRRNRPAAKDLS